MTQEAVDRLGAYAKGALDTARKMAGVCKHQGETTDIDGKTYCRLCLTLMEPDATPPASAPEGWPPCACDQPGGCGCASCDGHGHCLCAGKGRRCGGYRVVRAMVERPQPCPGCPDCKPQPPGEEALPSESVWDEANALLSDTMSADDLARWIKADRARVREEEKQGCDGLVAAWQVANRRADNAASDARAALLRELAGEGEEDAEEFARTVHDAVRNGAESYKPTSEYMRVATDFVLTRDARTRMEAYEAVAKKCTPLHTSVEPCDCTGCRTARRDRDAIRALATGGGGS